MEKLPPLVHGKWDALVNAFQPVEFVIEEVILKRGENIKCNRCSTPTLAAAV